MNTVIRTLALTIGLTLTASTAFARPIPGRSGAASPPPAGAAAGAGTSPAPACTPAPREIRGDGVDNNCNGAVDEPLTLAQLKKLVDDEVDACDCKDPATVKGQQARDLALRALTAANRLGKDVDPAEIEVVAPDCTTVALAGYEWDDVAWVNAASVSRAARGMAERLDNQEAMTSLLADTVSAMGQDQLAWRKSHDEQEALRVEEESSYRATQAATDAAQDTKLQGLHDVIYDTDADADGVLDTAGLQTRMGWAESEIRSAKDRIDDLEDADHNTLGVVLGAVVQTPEDTTGGKELQPGSGFAVGVGYSVFGAPFQAASRFSLGLDTVAVFLPSQRGLGLMPSAMLGADLGRWRFYAESGVWIKNAAQTGRQSGVTSYGVDIGARVDFVVREGVVLQARVLQSVYGLDSVRTGTEQCLYDGGLTLVTGGVGFSF